MGMQYEILCNFTEIIAITMPYLLFFGVNRNINKKSVVLFYILSLVIVVCDCIILKNNPISNVYLLSFVFLFLLEKREFRKNLLRYLIIILIESIFGGYCIVFSDLLFGIKYQENTSITFVSVVVFPVCQIIYWGICRLSKKEVNQFLLTRQQKIMLLVALVSNMFVIGSSYRFMYKDSFDYQLFLVMIYFFLLFNILFFVFTMIQARITWKNDRLLREQMHYEKVTNAQESYLNYVIKRDDELRKFRHDIQAHMIIMKDLVEQKKNDEALKYMTEIETFSKRYRMPHSSGISTIDAVVNELYERMEENHILFRMEGCLQNISSELTFELSICIYNLVLNAIEACERMKEANKEISLELKQYQQKLYIRVKNTCENMDNAEDIQDLNTLKADQKNHGYGSRNVREIVQKHQGKVVYSVKDNWFISEILV